MRIPVDRRVIPGVILLGSATIIFFFVFKPLLFISLFLFLFHLAFFRDPKRIAPAGNNPVSPADGTVVTIESVQEERFLNQEAYKIGIFLSVFVPHVSRAPIEGTATYSQYQAGKFLNALRSDSAELNECLWLGIEGTKQKALVRLISGAIARRIHCDIKKEGVVERGEKIGIICYGSRAEFYAPKNQFRVLVKIGDKVKAGQTILGEWMT